MRSLKEPLVISNEYIRVELSHTISKGLVGFIDLKTGYNFINSKDVPLYSLKLFKAGSTLIELTSKDAEDVRVIQKSDAAGEYLSITFDRHATYDISVTCQITLETGTALSKWRISVQNNTMYGIRSVLYPIVLTHTKLSETGEDDRFVWGFMGGQMIENPGKHLTTYQGVSFARVQYPGILTVQCQAYYDDVAGLYMATHDNSGAVKSFGATRLEDAFDLSIEHNYNEQPSKSFVLPYDTVLAAFHGDWYDAADLYREWAVQQPWCAKPLTKRDDIPAWLKEPRPWPCVISRGDYERLRGTVWSPPAEWPIGKFWPARNVIPMMKKYSELFGTPLVVWMEGWEYIGAPGGPVDIFPPLEGAQSFREAMVEIRKDGHIPFAYLAGLHWCYKRPMTGYHGKERFENEGRPLAAVNDLGQIDEYKFVNDQKTFAALCIGSEATQKLYLDNLSQLMDLGIVALQIDQQLGMYTQVCYSDQHDHPAGYGPWMYSKMLEFLRRARQAYKERDPEATFSYEVPCEIWIQEVDLHMHRPYHIRPHGLIAIPLFDYLYHEYALSYGGDTHMGLCNPEVDLIKHARIFTYGIQNLIGVGQAEWDYEVNSNYPTFTLMHNMAEAQRKYAHEYLVFGQMLKPTRIETQKILVDLYKPASLYDAQEDIGGIYIPAVFHSVWKAPSGQTGYVLANWTGEPQRVALEVLRPGDPAILIKPPGQKIELIPDIASGMVSFMVAPRSTVLVEQSQY